MLYLFQKQLASQMPVSFQVLHVQRPVSFQVQFAKLRSEVSQLLSLIC